jgi:hypothetical protein
MNEKLSQAFPRSETLLYLKALVERERERERERETCLSSQAFAKSETLLYFKTSMEREKESRVFR